MIQVNRIYLIFNRLVTKKFLVDTSELWMRISFFTASPFKDTKNRFNNVQKQDKCDKQNK